MNENYTLDEFLNILSISRGDEASYLIGRFECGEIYVEGKHVSDYNPGYDDE